MALEARLRRELYGEECKAVLRGEEIFLLGAIRISQAERRLGRRLKKDERRAISRGEGILPSAVRVETWMAHPDEKLRGKFKIFRGGAIDTNRRRH